MWLSRCGSASVMRGVAAHLRVTRYELVRLLGVPTSNHNCYRWFDGSQRPGAGYSLRVSHLLLIQSRSDLDAWEELNADPAAYWHKVGLVP